MIIGEDQYTIPYDYFRRGCAKSVVQVIHKALGTGAIHYSPWDDKYTKQTQRELVRNFIEGAPWEEFFMYFLILKGADNGVSNIVRSLKLLDRFLK